MCEDNALEFVGNGWTGSVQMALIRIIRSGVTIVANVQPDFANKARYKVVLIFNNAQDNAFKREVLFSESTAHIQTRFREISDVFDRHDRYSTDCRRTPLKTRRKLEFTLKNFQIVWTLQNIMRVLRPGNITNL